LQKATQQTTTQSIERVKAISRIAFTLISFMHKKISPFGEEVNTKVENDWTRPRELGVFSKGYAAEWRLLYAKFSKYTPF
jgi:hypothetical protein